MAKDLKKITSIEDLRRIAKCKVPRMFFDYTRSGSWTENTIRHNSADFDEIKFKQKILVDMTNRTLATTMVGEAVKMPVAIAPTGFTGMMHADGEIHAARAAEKFGVPFTLSTMSICSIEDVATHTNKPFWFQLYVMRDREFMENLIKRAKEAKCSALVLTVDLQVLGQRHRDIKNGLSAPPKPTLLNMLDLALRPEWCFKMLGTKRRTFGNIVGHAKNVSDLSSLSSWTSEQFDPRLSWDDVKRIQDLWGGKIILKGIMTEEDAILAAKTGSDALIVSNHGGRQLDGALSSIRALPEVIRGVKSENSNIEIWLDSGITSGQDVLKAMAMGAQGTMIGKSFLYGLGAYGEDGVRRCLEIIYNEMDISMAFCGHTDIKKVGKEILVPGTYPV